MIIKELIKKGVGINVLRHIRSTFDNQNAIRQYFIKDNSKYGNRILKSVITVLNINVTNSTLVREKYFIPILCIITNCK